MMAEAWDMAGARAELAVSSVVSISSKRLELVPNNLRIAFKRLG